MNPVCNHCGDELLAGVAGRRCPKCLLELALSTRGDEIASAGADFPWAGQRLGGYELLRELGRGGMGIVYQARQIRLNRVVALKLILSGRFASHQEVLRFRAEAEAAANLRHPNIVAIYETGDDHGQHFFSMEYVEGRDLAAMVRDFPLPAKTAARYGEVIARAIHYAHEQGTLHRDLKPSNILLDPTDQVRITDFGLAKRLRGDGGITATGQALGSPNFMPPEQAAGHRQGWGPAGDVYGIGAILYHLLTGRPPFQAATVEEVLRQVHELEPVAPRVLNSSIPQDLETVCLKCLEKDPAKRYASAAQLADELGRFMRDEPIQARPAGRGEKVRRWCRRKPLIAGLLAALGMVVLLGAGGVLWQWRRATESATALRHGLYAADINLASHVRSAKDINRAANLLRRHVPQRGEEDLRGFEWRYLSGLCRGEEAVSILAHTAEVVSVAVMPDGESFLTLGKDQTVKLWNLKTHQLKATLKQLAGAPLNSLAVAADGQRAAACDGVGVTLWNCADWSEIMTLNEPAVSLAYSPSKGELATSTGTGIKVWDLKSWMSKTLGNGPLERFAYSPDGRVIAVARREELELHDSASGDLLTRLPGKIQDHAYSLTFSPEGKFLATGGMYGEVLVWDVASRQVAAKFSPHGSFVSGLAFSPDGKWLATGGSDQFVTLGRVDGWRKEEELYRHSNSIWSLAFTPDSRSLLTASRDHTVKFWNVSREAKVSLLGDAQSLVGFLPDSQIAVTLDADTTLRYWDVASLRETDRHQLSTHATASLGALSADGRTVAIGFQDGAVELRRLPTSELWHRDSGGTNAIFALQFSADGQILASISVSLQKGPSTLGKLMLWNVASGERLMALTDSLGGQAGAVAFSPDQGLLAISRSDHSILLWDRAHHKPYHVLQGHTWDVSGLLFSADSRTLVSSSWDTSVRFWNVVTGQETARMPGLPVAAGPACFSPDGRTLAATFVGNAIQLWQVWNQQELLSLQWNGRFVGALHFTPDGSTLGTGRFLPLSPDGGVQLWRAPWSEVSEGKAPVGGQSGR